MPTETRGFGSLRDGVTAVVSLLAQVPGIRLNSLEEENLLTAEPSLQSLIFFSSSSSSPSLFRGECEWECFYDLFSQSVCCSLTEMLPIFIS